LLLLVLLPLQMLSGGYTPRERMPALVQFLMPAVIGTAFFSVWLARFRRTVGAMA
jgi:ABC-2 type transport system permease protein